MTLLDRRTTAGTASAPGVPGPSALSELLGDCARTFADRHWDRDALLVDHAPASSLLTLDDVDDLLAGRGLRAPFVRVARDGAVLAQSSYTSGGGLGATIADQVDTAKVARLLDEGCTVVLQGLHRVWPSLIDLADRLARESGHPVQVNAYLTPPAAQGFAPHFDTHDVLVVQTAGTKHWTIHRPPVAPALRSQDWSRHRAAVAHAVQGQPAYDVDLRPGSVLYLPRGWIHAARSQQELSLHVTIGIHARTRAQAADAVLAELRERLLHDDSHAAAMPWGVDVGTPGPWLADAADAVEDAVRRLPLEDVARRLARRRADETRPPGIRPVQQALSITALPERVRLAPGTSLTLDGDRLVRDGVPVDVVVAAMSAPWVTRLAAGEAVEVVDADLVRRLLRAALVVPAA